MRVKTWTFHDRGESSSLTSIFHFMEFRYLLRARYVYACVLPVASLYGDWSHYRLLRNQIPHIDMRRPNNYFGILAMREQCIIEL